MIWIHTITQWINSKFHSKFHSVESYHHKPILKKWFEIVPQHHDFISWIHTTSEIHTMMYWYEFMTASAFYLFLVGANSCFFVWIQSIFHEIYVRNSGMIHPLNYLNQWWNHRGFDFRPLFQSCKAWNSTASANVKCASLRSVSFQSQTWHQGCWLALSLPFFQHLNIA